MKSSELTLLEPARAQERQMIHLPFGLLGFEQIKEYLLLTEPAQKPFRWLQVLNDPTLAFLLISPAEFMDDYTPDIPDEDAGFLDICRPEDALIYNIVTLRPRGISTVNLKGPIVLNRFTLRGKQVILLNANAYSLSHPLPVEK
jgi:flagellar assembly factor FliW